MNGCAFEDELRLSREKFQTYIQRCPEGLIIVNESAEIEEVNPAICQLTGYSEQELLSMTLFQLTGRTDLKNFKLLEKNGEVDCEAALIKKDGNKILVDIHTVALGNKRYLGFHRDITEFRRIEGALKDSVTQNNLIINGISDMVALLKVEDDGVYRFLKTNQTLNRMLGLNEDQVAGKLMKELFSKGLSDLFKKRCNEVVKTGEPLKFEEDTGEFIFDSSIIPVLGKDEHVAHLIYISRDITERKKFEEHYLKSQKIESLGILAGGIAHDFNNIMTVISGNISLAKIRVEQHSEVGAVNALLSEVERALDQARTLTTQLLTFAKGGAPILKTVSIAELLKETTVFALRGSNVRCEYLIDEDLWPVEVDPGQINQVIQNLIINADQAMPDGGIIFISAQNVVVGGDCILPLKEGVYVKVSIKDQGRGISEEHLEKIFDPYFSTKAEGYGLGLATSYSIIYKHGGYIYADSKINCGATFHIYLPASQRQLIERQYEESTLLMGSGRILIMDDEESLRVVIRQMLEYMGYDVVTSRDGQEALDLYLDALKSGTPFDAVIMDLTIPGGMGGKELISRLIEVDPGLKAVVSSGYSNDPVMANYKEFGFQAVVSKPYNIEELGRVLNSLLHH